MTEWGIDILDNNLHSLKTNESNEVIEHGSSNNTSSNDTQPENARLSIEVTEEGIVILLSDQQSEKAEYPIEITGNGIDISVNDEQLLKEKCPTYVIEERFVYSRSLFEDSSVWNEIWLSDEHSIIATDEWIDLSVKDEQ